jgi:Bifunctional DNA primase/polymerase, N-terminal
VPGNAGGPREDVDRDTTKHTADLTRIEIKSNTAPGRLSSSGTPPMVDHALTYAMNGRPVFPCKWWPGDDAKAPLTDHGFKDATTDPRWLRYWWKKWPDALIGSPVPDDQVCIDIDPRKGVTLADLERVTGELPHTLCVISGRLDGGVHLFFKKLPLRHIDTRNLRKIFKDGIDIKTCTGYTILPPSLHPDTKAPYEWRDDEHWLGHPLGGYIYPLPPKAAVLILNDPDRPRVESHGVPNARALSGILRRVAEETSTRNNVLHWAACRLVENGYPETAFDSLGGAARYAGLPDSEIRKTINSARRIAA